MAIKGAAGDTQGRSSLFDAHSFLGAGRHRM
jgi:hypothetical protein